MRDPESLNDLVEAIYDAAVGADGWDSAMALVRAHFRTTAEAFYDLDRERAVVNAIHKDGIEPGYEASFAELYAAPDYPWRQAVELRKVGLVRTHAQLAAHLDDRDLLPRSRYYNDWLRPQRLEQGMGVTVLAERDVVANVELFRAQGDGAFTAAEVQELTRIGRHLRRALTMSRRLDLSQRRESLSFAALDQLPYGVAALHEDGAIVFANRAAEALLAAGDGLRVRDGRIGVVDAREADKLGALLRAVSAGVATPECILLRRAEGHRLALSAMPLSASLSAPVSARPTVLLLLADPDAPPRTDDALLRRLYRLTEAELRLTRDLIGGHSLRESAEMAGITYETVRWHLKSLFRKTETNRQSELVAKMLRDLTAAPSFEGRERTSRR